MTRRLSLAGLFLGPVVAAAVYVALPSSFVDQAGQLSELTPQARAAAAAGAWMAVWWLTEAIPLYATALLPLAVFPLAGVLPIKATAASYGHELIFLFLGGFVLALALERWGVHRRIALAVIGAVGTRPSMIVGAFMAVAAFLSMWVTNTATTIMLLPVALSVIHLPAEADDDGDETVSDRQSFKVCLLLGIAYAASIGGIGTIVGTAPNLFVVSFLQSRMDFEISFASWMMIGVPLVLVFVPICWWLLCRRIYPLSSEPLPGMRVALDSLSQAQGPMSRGERLALAVFVLTAAAWMSRPLLNDLSLGGWRPLEGLTDPGIAILSAMLLFVIPVELGKRVFLMDWETAVKLPWGLLILFGGGLSLAAALDQSGFSSYLGAQAAGLGGLPPVLIVAMVTAMMIFLTELTSNTATTATLIPVLYAVAVGLEVHPLLFVLPAGIAASCAFMLPVATPPNAIVFGSGEVGIQHMSRAGFWLNIVGIVLITGMAYGLALPLLGALD